MDDSMIASSDPIRIQGVFSTLVALFDRLGLKKKSRKMVGMVSHLCQAAGT